MDKKTVSPGLILLLVLLVAVGIFLLYSRLTFTGYVTNVANATTGVLLSSHNFNEGPGVSFSNTYLTTDGNVALQLGLNEGIYTSRIFDAGQNALWTEFFPVYVMHSSTNYTEDPLNNSILFYVRACNDSVCTGKDFVMYSNNLNLLGQYFQYKATMQIFSGNESPILSEVNVSYYPPNTLPINIESPQNIVYNNESVLIKISSNPGVTIWFYNGTDNELYVGEFNKTFSQGTHILNVFVSYLDGRINYTNSASVTFTVGFLHTYYRFVNNACSVVTIIQAQKTANDYNTLAECESHIISTTSTTTTSETQSEVCAPSWECFFNETDAWSECIDGIQTRTCVDTSTCTAVASIESRPPETRACSGGITTTAAITSTETETTTPTETETTKKGFFSFVGSAIIGPVFKSKVGVTFIILLVLAIGGLLAYKFFLKDKLKLKFFSKKGLFNFK